MLTWVRANYKEAEMDPTGIITTLEDLGSPKTGYNIFKTPAGWHMTVFSDQKDLLNMIRNNIHSLFIIGLVAVGDTKRYYKIGVDGEKVSSATIARAAILIPGTSENARSVDIIEGHPVIG